MESNRTETTTQQTENASVNIDDVHLETQNTTVSKNNLCCFKWTKNYKVRFSKNFEKHQFPGSICCVFQPVDPVIYLNQITI